jgi:hypothetical protein
MGSIDNVYPVDTSRFEHAGFAGTVLVPPGAAIGDRDGGDTGVRMPTEAA